MTEEEIENVREVAGESDYDYISDLIDALNDSQTERALELVEAWAEIPLGNTALSGGRDGVRVSDEVDRSDIRRRMRLLLGLPEFRAADMMGASLDVRTMHIW